MTNDEYVATCISNLRLEISNSDIFIIPHSAFVIWLKVFHLWKRVALLFGREWYEIAPARRAPQ
jgi:hypothetical protein